MYFAALLARTEDGWEASDTELDDVETLSDLTELAREASVDEDTVVVYMEQEDSWFAIVRVDGEDDARIYVSDGAAAARSSYGEILTKEILGTDRDDDADDLDALDLDGTEDGEPEAEDDGDDDGAAADAAPSGPVGDRLILEDLGVSERDLRSLEPGDALSDLAEALGAAEVLETVR
ncbi:hypothetical protein ACGFMM_28875 [Streptomyces sp. NPDC048604]|uniref:tRNA adenosine deaminase-associated protein n=1 Tax=Streptomyces sp. NPDC048604 TaxID=3365578 RepID=UPI00371BE88E